MKSCAWLAILLLSISSASFASNSCNHNNCNDDDDVIVPGGDGGDASAGAVGIGGDSEANSAVLGSGNSANRNHASGGDADSSSSAGAVSGSASGVASTIDASDNSSYSSSYRYEEAAKSAAILYGQVCSDVTNIQGLKLGIGSSKQSYFCQRLTLAQGYFASAVMLECASPENIAKGAVPIRTPSPSDCERQQRRLYLDGQEQLQKAEVYLDGQKDGVVKKLWGLIW